MRFKTSGILTPCALALAIRSIPMKKYILATALISTVAIAGLVPAAYAAPVPCEDMLKTLTDILKTAKLNDADMKMVTELQTKGTERCNADDDKRADAFFTDALKLAGKK